MEKQKNLSEEIEKKLKERLESFSFANNTELEELFQDVLAHLKELEKRNQRLETSQTELSALKERYADLFDNAPAGYFILDSTFKVQEVNNTACSYFGMKCEELKGRFFKDFVDEEYHKLLNNCFKENDSGNFISKCDLKLKTENADFYGRIIVSANDKEDKSDKFRVAVIDISKEKELEDKLIGESKKARENERLKSAFMANMSHEIRTPMNGIMGFSELLQEPDLSPENLQSYINIIQNSGKRMLSIINELVDISKIESGTVHPVMVKTNVDELLDYIHEYLLPDATKKGLSLIIDSEKADGVLTIKSDKEKLHAIFVNLLKNAINYTSEGQVTFGYSKKDGHLEFYVSDTGQGIQKEELNKVFERFYRVAKSSQTVDGVGLGLPISKAFVEMLGGTIWVESEPGNGSTFRFTLPLSETNGEITDDNQRPKLNTPNDLIHYMNILVAEDDEPAQLYLSELLENKCKNLYFARNGREAVDMYAELKPDMVLMDIKMPVMDGYSAAIKIKGIDEKAIIIAQTAYALAGDREKALAAGCSDYLAKPVLKDDLLTMIRKHFM